MKKIYYLLSLLFIGFTASAGLYNSPGTGVNWTLSDLVANSNGSVTFDGTQYVFVDSVTIVTGDVLRIETDATVKFNPLVVFKIQGALIINPPTGVLFTASIEASSYRGLWFDFSSGSSISKLTYEYAMALRVNDCSPSFDQCIFRRNNVTTYPSISTGTIVLARANSVFTNCQFLENFRNAISASSLGAAPKFFNCVFSGNIRSSQNTAQINLGSSGADTIKVVGCTIINPGNIRGGAISLVPQGNTVHVLINNNNISGNRYGINMAGGEEINAMISYNLFADNNIENNPLVGGSGIAFTNNTLFGTATAQKAIVTGNTFQNNLWGVTIQNRSAPNLGNLNNADTSDDGKNKFINNTNASTPGIDLYNNSVDPIFAMGNYWNTNIETEVEGKIFHQPDNAAFGLVTYSNFILPIELVSFTANRQNNHVALQWKTAQESNSSRFEIERSADGLLFSATANVAAAGNSNSLLTYNYTDLNVSDPGTVVYYRLKLVDLDGSFKYSSVVAVAFPTSATKLIRYYPTSIVAGGNFATELISEKAQRLNIQYFDATGKLLLQTIKPLVQGFNKIDITIPLTLKGAVMMKINAGNFNQTIPVIIQ